MFYNLLLTFLFFFQAFLSAGGFIAGTKVWLQKDGEIVLENIENVKAGDLCCSLNTESKKVETSRVVGVVKKTSQVVKLTVLTVACPDVDVVASVDQLFLNFVPGVDQDLTLAWQKSSSLKWFSQAACMNRGFGSVVTFVFEREENLSPKVLSDSKEVFALSLEGNHNYFVSDMGLVVHNIAPVAVGITFVFGEGVVKFSGAFVVAAIGGLFLKSSMKKNQKFGRDSFPGAPEATYSLDVQTAAPAPPPSKKIEPESVASTGGPQPPKKDDDDEGRCDKKKSACENDLDYERKLRLSESQRANNADERANLERADKLLEKQRADRLQLKIDEKSAVKDLLQDSAKDFAKLGIGATVGYLGSKARTHCFGGDNDNQNSLRQNDER